MAERAALKQASSIWLGALVILLYILFVFAVAFGFGSYIFRTSWETEPPRVEVTQGGQPILRDQNIDNMVFILRREWALEAARGRLDAQVREERALAADQAAQVKLSYGPIARSEERLRVYVNLVLSDLTEFQYLLPGAARSKYEIILSDEELRPDVRLTALLDLVAEALPGADTDAETRARFEDLSGDVRLRLDDHLAAIGAANAASHEIQQEKLLTDEKILSLLGEQADYDAQIAALRAVLPVASPTRARLSALLLEWWVLPTDIVLRLVSFPTIFLTLIVTIAAGGLGTVVAFSRRYYSGGDRGLTVSRLFVNVGEGIAAAIAIFLFSGAGMLALTQGGGANSDVELSPYTVAFIAFVSGFMAEDAFAAIQAAGKRLFKVDDPEEPEKDNGSVTPSPGPQ